MKIQKIQVTNLFGNFNHEISLNTKEHITIIHGPNGIGKTIILSMLDKLFHSHYSDFYNIPFLEFRIFFDDGGILTIKKESIQKTLTDGPHNVSHEILIEYQKDNGELKRFKTKSINPKNIGFPLSIIDEIIPELRRLGSQVWINKRTDERYSLLQVIESYHDRLPLNKDIYEGEPSWLKEITSSVNIHLIETQRLLKFKGDEEEYHYNRSSVPTPSPIVLEFSSELCDLIEKAFANYGTLSQSIDRNFPLRLLEGENLPNYTIKKLKTDLLQLEEKRLKYERVGLYDTESNINFEKFLNKINDDNRQIISEYVNDTQKKMKTLDTLYNKINILVTIINNRFLYKTLSIQRKKGFVFTSKTGEIISPKVLSSGEQHELVLFYDLLFHVDENSLILIDEPELSLHVYWQEQFINDLLEITKIIGFDALIATHSPDIINDRWNLTVKLEGPSE